MSRPKPSGRSEAEIRRLMQEAATSGRVDSARTSVAGFGRREAGKAAWAARSDSKRSYHDVFNGVIVPTSESVQNIPFAKLSGMTDAQTLALQKAHHAVLQLVL